MISLCTGEKVISVWKESFSCAAPSYIASASAGALAMILFQGFATAVLLFIVPIAYFAYRALSTSFALAEEKVVHAEDLRAKQAELASLYLATIESLALAIEAKDPFTHQHIVRSQKYAVALAKEIGLDGDELQGVSTGALLHDIGKLGVPETILLKPGPLTNDEFDQIKQHPTIGAAILDPVEFPWPVLPVVKHHHERWDGKGYPSGLKGEEIPLTARIMAIADTYDALTSVRSYRGAMSHAKAVEVIRNGAGGQFDPTLVEVFLRIIDSVIADLALKGLGPLAQKSSRIEAAASTEPERPMAIPTGNVEMPVLILTEPDAVAKWSPVASRSTCLR
jgi:putative nucleotidyltransferase with HDIG domain